MNTQDIEAILANIEWSPSCVDMGWQWKVRAVYSSVPGATGSKPCAFELRTTFRRPDRDTGEISTGYGRWWSVPVDVSESGLVKTAFAAAKLILEHELLESFKYRSEKWGVIRVFDPHHDIDGFAMAAFTRRMSE